MKASTTGMACGAVLLGSVLLSAGCTQKQVATEMMPIFPDETCAWLKAHPEYKPTSPAPVATVEKPSKAYAAQVHSVDVGFSAVGQMPVQWIGPNGPVNNSPPVSDDEINNYYGR